MYEKLVEELKYFQAHFKTSEQKYFLETNEPTAVDFSVYAQMARLLAGGTNDYEIPASVPSLLEESSLERILQWYKQMREEIFVHFKGKRKPKEAQ